MFPVGEQLPPGVKSCNVPKHSCIASQSTLERAPQRSLKPLSFFVEIHTWNISVDDSDGSVGMGGSRPLRLIVEFDAVS